MNWHPDFRIDGISPEKWIENSGVEYAEVAKGISEWNSEKTEFTFMTSGSTGVPKAISISRDVMIHSAKSTGKYFNLENGSTAFLCLPVEFIGGFMMLVRSMVIGLNITVSHPQVKNIIKSDSEFDFVAMTPFQVSKILEASPDFFNGIKYLIIGGGLVPAELRNKLYLLNTNCYSTYGMTETCSHIALNRIEPNNARFIGFLDVNFTTNLQDQLVISAPNFGVRELVTNDLVVLINAHS
ncbi:MAG: AMP-binding protein, partial [Salibacteraceae bacterium]